LSRDAGKRQSIKVNGKIPSPTKKQKTSRQEKGKRWGSEKERKNRWAQNSVRESKKRAEWSRGIRIRGAKGGGRKRRALEGTVDARKGKKIGKGSKTKRAEF